MSLYSNFQAFSNSIKLALSRKADKTELSLKADKTEIPTAVSELTNDSGYLTDAPTYEIYGSGTTAKYTNSEILSMFLSGKVMTFLGNPVITVTDETNQTGVYYVTVSNGNPSVNKITVDSSKTIATGTRPSANFADVSGKEDASNKVTSISSSSTDTQYPSAKCVYDLIGGVIGGSY